MAFPDKPAITYSYTGFQQTLGDNSFPGTQMDADLAGLVQYASATVDFLKLFSNSDGSLKLSAIPDTADLASYTAAAASSASAAAASASSASANAVQAASSSSSAVAARDAAIVAQGAAATSAASASTTLAASLTKAQNLADLTDASVARTNLGLGSFSTKSSLVLADVGVGFFTADATGRGKFASGFVDSTLVAAGAVVQVVRTDSSAFTTSAVVIPNDDTIPQSTEGAAVTALNTTITPKSATNILLVEVCLNVTTNTTATMMAALFKDSETSARAAASVSQPAGYAGQIVIRYQMVAGATTATTFGVRVGPNTTATVTVNGAAAARLLGGALFSSIQVTEVKA